MSNRIQNIFENIPADLKEEFFDELINTQHFKLERIVSEGHSSPPGFWYDQDKNEFVMLLTGSAEIAFENEGTINLQPGDYAVIPAHKKHRVEKTDSETKTFWIALHY